MVWQPYWIYSKTYKNTPFKRSPGEDLLSLIALFLDVIAFVCECSILFCFREQREEELGEYYMKKYANSASGEQYVHPFSVHLL